MPGIVLGSCRISIASSVYVFFCNDRSYVSRTLSLYSSVDEGLCARYVTIISSRPPNSQYTWPLSVIYFTSSAETELILPVW